MKKNNLIPTNKNNLNLTAEESERLIQGAIFSSMIDELKIENQINEINYNHELEIFYKTCSKNNSKHTEKQYKLGLTRLENYVIANNKNILKLKPSEADDFAISLQDLSLSNATVRTIISSCSTFFTFLERRHQVIKNPFRGTRTRPPIKNKKRVQIPTVKELNLIISNIKNPNIKLNIEFIKSTGIRVGAIDTLKIKGSKYHAYSKGKEITGTIPPAMLSKIKNIKEPFKSSSEVTRVTFATTAKRLYNNNQIKAAYSVHDIRHLFAVTFYKKTKDIYALKNLLNHSSIAITEVYLKSLDV